MPAYFGAAERAATLTACQLAGLPEVSLLREPEVRFGEIWGDMGRYARCRTPALDSTP